MRRKGLLKNKLYAVTIVFLGTLSVSIDREATFFLFALMLGFVLFFSKENWIM